MIVSSAYYYILLVQSSRDPGGVVERVDYTTTSHNFNITFHLNSTIVLGFIDQKTFFLVSWDIEKIELSSAASHTSLGGCNATTPNSFHSRIYAFFLWS